jgi:REP element-mobilizing transposase RayT
MRKKGIFRDKYKTNSLRLKYWDYSTPDWYYVTICTKYRSCHFGEVVMGKNEPEMEYSEIGEVAKWYWEEIPKRYPNVTLDVFQIMPNHIHGIVVINELQTPESEGSSPVAACPGMLPQGEEMWPANFNQFSKPIKGSLSMIINHYKGDVTKWCNQNGYDYPIWQSLFYEHIIRNEKDLSRIRDYIINNPTAWYYRYNVPRI